MLTHLTPALGMSPRRFWRTLLLSVLLMGMTLSGAV